MDEERGIVGRELKLTGVIHGKTITLDEATFLPDGCPVRVSLTLSPEEALRQMAIPGPDLTEEELAELEEILSDCRGRPVKLPPPEKHGVTAVSKVQGL